MKKILKYVISLTLTFLLASSSSPSLPINIYTPAKSLASLGDSLTVAANACGDWLECPEESWSTGQNSTTVKSFADKLLLLPQAAEKIEVYNNAKPNTQVSDLPRQALLASQQEAEFITILSGANDACTYSVENMTPPKDFKKSVEETLQLINQNLPYSKIFVVSIPNLTSLWQTGRQSVDYVNIWDKYRMCHSLMADPNGFTLEAIERRKQVDDMIDTYNNIFSEACSNAENCLFDNNRLHDHNFSLNEISNFDGFHPSTFGQATIANLLWNDFTKIHAQILRGTTSSSSLESPLVTVIAPTQNAIISGENFRLLTRVKSSYNVSQVYVDTQIGVFDLTYDKTLNLWFLDLDTTLAPNGLKTSFSVVVVDEENNVGVSENITVKVDNSASEDGIIIE